MAEVDLVVVDLVVVDMGVAEEAELTDSAGMYV